MKVDCYIAAAKEYCGTEFHGILKVCFSLILVIIVLYGCTERMVYEGARGKQRHECMKMPETERDRCLEETSKEYDEYKREREEATGQR
jgi:hypothetical protein